jgi:hypothetical protein
MAMPISSKVGSSYSSLLLVAWSKHKGVQSGGGMMKSAEDGSGLSFPSMVLCTSGAKLDP